MCQASAAIPGVFPPSHINGRVLFDGATIWNVNTFSAIEGCRQLGFKDKDIILDVIMNSYAELHEDVDISKFGTFDIFFRYVRTLSQTSSISQITTRFLTSFSSYLSTILKSISAMWFILMLLFQVAWEWVFLRNKSLSSKSLGTRMLRLRLKQDLKRIFPCWENTLTSTRESATTPRATTNSAKEEWRKWK